NAQAVNAAADHLDNQRAKDRAQRGTLAARQAGASDDCRGDDVQFVSLSIARGSGAIIANREQGSDARGQTGQEVNAQFYAPNLEAAEAGGQLIASDRIDAAAKSEASQENAAGEGHEQHEGQRH